jgi:putative oxidoreductase
MAYGLFFLRLVIGLIFFAHGAQKLLGWWDGPGLEGTRGWLGSMGLRMPGLLAIMVAASETSGLLFALGLLTPFVAMLMCSAMIVAIGSVHWRNGFWNVGQGFEFNLALLAVPIAVSATGPGRLSLDRAIGWDDNLSGPIWGVAVFTVALVGALFVLTVMREGGPRGKHVSPAH